MIKLICSLLVAFSINITYPAQTGFLSPDTITTSSGLKYIIVSRGSGAKADTGMEVEVNYNWYLSNGSLIGSSFNTGRTYHFILGKGKVIKGWDEGIALMHVGDHFKFIIPPQLAYGSKGAGRVIPPNSTLIYDTYLLGTGTPKKEFIDTLYALIIGDKYKEAVALYKNLYKTKFNEYDFGEDQLKILGFKVLLKEMRDEAIRIFKLNTEMYPKSADAFNSLGEAYLKYHKNDLALENFKKALALDPSNAAAKYEINKLSGK